MYRSIHSGVCPPTGSTFCTKSNAYNCGIYNLGGSTDGAFARPVSDTTRVSGFFSRGPGEDSKRERERTRERCSSDPVPTDHVVLCFAQPIHRSASPTSRTS